MHIRKTGYTAKKVPICFFPAFARLIGPPQPKEYPTNPGFLSMAQSTEVGGFSESCFHGFHGPRIRCCMGYWVQTCVLVNAPTPEASAKKTPHLLVPLRWARSTFGGQNAMGFPMMGSQGKHS